MPDDNAPQRVDPAAMCPMATMCSRMASKPSHGWLLMLSGLLVSGVAPVGGLRTGLMLAGIRPC